MRSASVLVAAALLSGGCALIVGIDDHTLGTTTASGGGGTSSSSSGGGTGGTNACAPPDLGPTMCPPGMADCDGDGTCESALGTNTSNCGSCGHDCLGGACSAGKCQEVELSPQYPVTEAFGPMAVADGRVYFVAGQFDANKLYWASVIDGKPNPVSMLPIGQVYDIAIDLNAALPFAWATSYDNGQWGLYGVIATGGTPAWFQDLDDYTNGMAVHADSTLYVATLHRITFFDPDTGTPHDAFIDTQDVIRGLAMDDDHIYWASYPDGAGGGKLGQIRRATRLGADVTVLAAGLDQPEKIALDGSYAYWTDSAAGTVSRVLKAGGTPETLVTGQVNPKQIAVAGDDLYWSADAGLYHVRLCALGAPEQLSNDSVGGIGVDAKRVVMSDTHYHQILGFAR